MARARNIKPSFFQNEELSELPALARLLFIGLWTIADYKGCIEFRPKRIKVQLLPYDDCDTEELASALDKSGFVRIYSVGDQRYLKIINFERHQNPHKNEKDAGSEIPDMPAEPLQHNDLQSIQNNLEQDGTAPADSLFLIPDSLNLNPSSLSSPVGEEGNGKKPPIPACPHQQVLDLYHEKLPLCPRVREWHKTRQGYLQSRWREKAMALKWPDQQAGLEWFDRFFGYVGESAFLTGKTNATNGRPPFVADLEWILKPTNFAKIVEGKYS